MKTNPYLIILIGLIITFLLTVYGVSKNEYFTNFASQKNNLIHNGSFEGGKDITEKIKVEGNNQIVVLENPGASSYVLKQSHMPNGQNYYLLKVAIEPDEHYRLGFWYTCEGGSDLEETLLKLEIKDKNHRNHTLRGNTIIKQKAQIDGREWYLIEFHLQVPASLLDNNLYIYLGYNMLNGTRYYTDVSLNKYLTDVPGFNITNGLQVFLEGKSLDPAEHIHNMIWKDVSEKGNDFSWQNKPKYHPDGYYHTYGNSLRGPSGQRLFKNELFSIGLHLEVAESVEKPKNGEENLVTNYRELIRIPGNNEFSLRIWIPLFYGKIVLDIADVRYETTRDVITRNNNIYFFNYDGTSLQVYVNNALISTLVPKNKIHFNNQNVVINYDNNLRSNLYNIIMYDRVLKNDETNYIVKYLQKGNAENKSVVQRWFHHLAGSEGVTGIGTGTTKKIVEGNQNAVDDYGKKNQPSCGNGSNSSGSASGSGSKNGKDCWVGECPKVVFQKDEYWVFIPSGSRLQKMVGYCGYKSYGRDQANARKMFRINFPSCKIPDILVTPKRHPNFGKCPYIIRDGNPCFSEACADVDWSIKNPRDAKLSHKCRRDINHYCERYNKYDPSCMCWKPQYRDSEECVKFRRNFLDPHDYNCKINYFKIEEHPDISNYVRKDRIPCWGCNLDTNGNPSENGNNGKQGGPSGTSCRRVK